MDPENARTQVVRHPKIIIKHAKNHSSQFKVLLLKSFQLPGKKEALHKFHRSTRIIDVFDRFQPKPSERGT